MHPYAVQGDILPLLSDSTTSTPEPKKSKSEPSLSEIQENIMRCINERVNGLEELLRANTVGIEALKKRQNSSSIKLKMSKMKSEK